MIRLYSEHEPQGTLKEHAVGFLGAAREQFRKARTEPLITLGSAPLDV